MRTISPSKEYADKEWKEALRDIAQAKFGLKRREYKWGIIAAYYAMFHAAKCLLFLNGLKEKSHYGVSVVLEAWANEGRLSEKSSVNFKGAMFARESADYHYEYSEKACAEMLFVAEEFLGEAEERKSSWEGAPT